MKMNFKTQWVEALSFADPLWEPVLGKSRETSVLATVSGRVLPGSAGQAIPMRLVAGASDLGPLVNRGTDSAHWEASSAH